jgi:alkylhydroperoxidase family enzyme
VAHINYRPDESIPDADRVPDDDNIIRIHGVHSSVMRLHYDLYVELMRGPSSVSPLRREMIAVAVSVSNGCRY